ncbi:glycoside hydrolase family 127 protein [Parabacteroides faecis]|uniref:glycoside hydrolase family 127 protein n=1 Tax=Parabacteroides faecis TaxID=1217282 RepID=UPI00216449D9|nr:glycoside hydrolase family 127 protein [Parabacteroides faecis]MCS2891950.1 glycoside hydrolase family 127 protein [Parabacteroides faecis]UVQ44447.1 glycoside hydrolase family 127 protein [Parabacteroides faecis]
MKKSILFLSLICGACTAPQDTLLEQVDRLSTSTQNDFYVSNRAPLQPQQFIKLPAGTIQPEGWLKQQLELQKEGLNGHLGEISAWLQKKDNAWLETGGQWGWEEVPYWLRGYANLAYIVEDNQMLNEAKFWIEGILKSQREDGNFGPMHLNDGKQDFWPNMIVLWIMQSYYEYSNDERIIDFMTKYCNYLLTVPDEDFLYSYWENSRGGDNLWSVVWLYNHTGDKNLLTLGEKIHKNTADWTKSTQLPNWHNVNVAQCFREPATYYLFSGDSSMLAASYNVQSLVRRAFGQVPGGMFGADENARIGFFDPRQGTETCGFVEQMASDEIMLQISGDPYWAENCEDVAFNSYPAALMPDYKALRYITSPNHVVSDSKNHHPGIDNSGPFLSMNPFSSRCCQHNHGFGWPYYTENLIYATPDNGIAAVLYNACQAKVKVGNGTEVTIKEQTNYPFEETIRFTLTTPEKVSFPLYLRIPSWCKDASIAVNGQKLGVDLTSGKYAKITREWSDADEIVLTVPMTFNYRQWQVNKNSVSVDYGPLSLSLKIDEDYQQKDSRETAIGDSKWQEGADASAWPTYEIYPASPWNYALQFNSPISVQRKEWPFDNNPFTLTNVPLEFKAKGRLIPEWKIDEYGLCGVLPYEDAPKADTLDEITLVPMGAARLRIASFPTTE